MTRYKLTLEYDGRGFVGWQRQDNGPSIQQALEQAIAAFSGEAVTTVGAGRTDAGAHAL
ncbi:MAG: tRNA pseudouridine(38-40) synthase TruA, partial [Alphaproteobacteria bacterium]